MAIDEDALNELLGRFVADLGATMSAANLVVGDRLGLYRKLAEIGPASSTELAARTGTAERYVREWLRGQAAAGYLTYDAEADRYRLTEEQAVAFADPAGLALPGAFQLAATCFREEATISEAFRTGRGLGWHEHDPEVFTGTERFFRPGYVANIVSSWIPALDGVADRLTAGGTVADVGCGLGTSSRLVAEAFRASTVVGSDYHAESIRLAVKAAADAGLADRVSFEVAAADAFTGTDYDLVATFDCLHDMGDPVAAARHIRQALAPDGTWMLVEPYAEDDVAGNLNPVGRVYYGFSTFLCVPHAISEHASDALGNQAGEPRMRAIAAEAGFTRFRRAAETVFNIVYEVRP
jgi:2-polyprenyl-3-methyl-5-hydroxy-6-metoxy-1,4-benzoquinol methylase